MEKPIERKESAEQLISHQEIVNFLNAFEKGAPEAMEKWGKYVDQCHAEATVEGQTDTDPVTTNRATIKAEIKIARACLDARDYFEEGMGYLEDAHMAAECNESTYDLGDNILDIKDEYDNKKEIKELGEE